MRTTYWTKASPIGQVKYTYDRDFHTRSLRIDDMNYRQYQLFEEMLKGIQGMHDPRQAQTKDQVQEQNAPKAQENSAQSKRKRIHFSDDEVSYIESIILGTPYHLTWPQVALCASYGGYILRDPATIAKKLEFNEEVQRHRAEHTAPINADTPCAGCPCTNPLHKDRKHNFKVFMATGSRDTEDLRHEGETSSEANERIKRARTSQAYKKYQPTQERTPAPAICNDTARTYSSEGWDR